MNESVQIDSGLSIINTPLGNVVTGERIYVKGFRSYPIGISADIEKAFLQLEIAPTHRDFLSFFYPKEDEEIIYRHFLVVFGVSSSPFLLAVVLSHLLENTPIGYSEIVDKLKLSFYVDNCVTGVNNVKQLEEFTERAKEVLSRVVLDGNHLPKRLRVRAKIIQVLKERFRKEYLDQLVQRHRQHPQSSNIHIGDIVLIGDDVKKRLQWPLARVIELIPGKDGHVRTVRVKTQHSTLVLEVSGIDFQKQLGPSADSFV
ncbi:hypothetical protein HNY73_016200 [Argiope bruennichi]|uniref:DUF5641 domain-containing protein n=1 Tax=Argiope bruennichi TaxID=94029 RepID=A0A8T0ELZ4_ARGBR|nr:hypothetical protein HNY73_016200 [Argiope bruennichi]